MMKDIYIIKDFFEKSEEVFDFLKNKNCNVNLIEKKETLNLEKNKSTIICSKKFQDSIGGKSEVLKISRKIGSTNIVVLDNSDAKYSILSELGGAYLVISFSQFDEVINEVIFLTFTSLKDPFETSCLTIWLPASIPNASHLMPDSLTKLRSFSLAVSTLE